MLIYLTDSLLANEKDADYQSTTTSIENILKSGYEGKHLILGDNGILSSLRGNNDLSQISRQYANSLYQSYAMRPIPTEVSSYIKVVRGGNETLIREKNRVAMRIPIDYFNDSSHSQDSVLIGEHYYDCEFYEYVLQWYKSILQTILHTKFEHQPGGGGATEQTIRQIVGYQKRIAICIVDTDKRYPNDNPSNTTYDKCKGLYKNVLRYKFLPLEVHEIENLIPYNILDKLNWPGENFKKKERFDKLRIEAAIANAVLPFFDLKNGIKRKDITSNAEYWNFARICYNASNEKSYDDIEFDALVKSLGDNDIVCDGLSSRILKNSITYIKENNFKPKNFASIEFQRKCWEIIGQTMLDWGCAAMRGNIY